MSKIYRNADICERIARGSCKQFKKKKGLSPLLFSGRILAEKNIYSLIYAKTTEKKPFLCTDRQSPDF